MHSKLLGLSLITGLMSATAFAEPAIQSGDTLESLSKVKVMTTVNGQAGSIQDLVASGQIQIVESDQTYSSSNQIALEAPMQQTVSENQVVNTAPIIEPSVEQPQSMDAPLEQATTVAPEHMPAVQPNAELAVQQAEQVLEQEIATQTPMPNSNNAPMMSSSAQAPVNADNTQTDVTVEAFTAIPANAADTNMATEALTATPESNPSNEVIQAIPNTDAPINAAPDAPMADSTEH